MVADPTVRKYMFGSLTNLTESVSVCLKENKKYYCKTVHLLKYVLCGFVGGMWLFG